MIFISSIRKPSMVVLWCLLATTSAKVAGRRWMATSVNRVLGFVPAGSQLSTERTGTRCFASNRPQRPRTAPRGGAPKTNKAALPEIIYREGAAKRVIIAGGKARLFKDGNPLVYGGAVAEVHGGPADGELIPVTDQKDNLIGAGVYNKNSMYRVRMLWHAGEAGYDSSLSLGDIVGKRLDAALALRASCGLPSEETSCYRLIHAEGDRLSGLVVDVYGDMAVVASSALWVEQVKESIEAAVLSRLSPKVKEVVWRRSDGRLEQDGWLKPGASAKGAEGEEDEDEEEEEGMDEEAGEEEEDGPAAAPREMKEVWVNELGLKYKVLPEMGQKTGFYCDQRDSRGMVRELSKGKKVLDLFCYSGGFAMNAARGGAAKVIGVDSSARALETAVSNAAANNLDVTFERADAVKYMQQEITAGRKYDVIILDPPKLAPSRKALPRATLKYRRLNSLAMGLVEKGGLLLTCTCSSAMATTPGAFLDMIKEAAQIAGRQVTVVKTGATGVDHPTNPHYLESQYLMSLLLFVH